jgi:hypothetical protein
MRATVPTANADVTGGWMRASNMRTSQEACYVLRVYAGRLCRGNARSRKPRLAANRLWWRRNDNRDAGGRASG